MTEVTREAFEHFPYGIVVVDPTNHALMWNRAASALLGDLTADAVCCSLLRCGEAESPLKGACFSELARDRGAPLPEVRVDLRPEISADAAWVTAAPLGTSGRVLLEVRPGEPGDRRRRTTPHWVAGAQLRIYTLGRTRVESFEGSLGGKWLERRTGQVFKYLVTQRRRVVQTDEIADNVWHDADMRVAQGVRYFIHQLRAKIEPSRATRAPSMLVVSFTRGYQLNGERVWVDADEFADAVGAGLVAMRQGRPRDAEAMLNDAMELYTGDYMADEPYTEWVFAERSRLRELANDALRVLIELRVAEDDAESVRSLVARLAAMDPFDMEAQRALMGLMLSAGRRQEAVEHFSALCARLEREFGEVPDFTLADVASGIAG